MNVAATKEKKSPAVEFLKRFTDLINADKYKEASEAFKAFEKDYSTADFMVLEAVPFKLQNRMIAKIGSPTAFSIYSLRHPTWTTEVTDAFEDPAKFEAFVNKLEADVRALIAKK
jgi:hypothetical protein